MKTLLAAGACALALSGCASSPGNNETVALVLKNLQGCERTYQLQTGAFGVPGGSLFIRCPAQPVAPPADPPAP